MDKEEENYWLRLIIKIIFQDELQDLRKQVKKESKYKFLIPLARNNKENIRLLYENNYKMPRESVNLLHQANITLNSAKILLRTKRIVDVNTLIRSSFEYILMGMMILFDDNVYEEYKILGLRQEDRKYTKIQQLINKFKKNLKKIDKELFSIHSNRKLGEYLTDLYDKLCLYTHSTLIVNEMMEVKLNDDEDLFIIIAKQNILFLEILLNSCLKYITKNETFQLDYIYVFLTFAFMYYEVDYRKYKPDYLQKYKNMLYGDVNKDFFENSKLDIDYINESAREIDEILCSNPEEIIKLIKSLIEK